MALEGSGRRKNRGEHGGEWEERPRGRGVATLSPRLVAGEGGFGWDVPCSDPGRGNREGRRQEEAGRFGRMGQVG